jgi:arylsulfatase A-like enzyme
MNRTLLPLLVALGLLLPLLLNPDAGPAAGAAQAPMDRPNVLLIVTDDQRIGTMRDMRDTRDWLSNQGSTFTNAFVTTPACCPSRASILTGLYAHNHGVLTNHQGENLDHTLTIERILQEDGYRTGIVGKFLNGWGLEQDPPFFDEWAVMRLNTATHDDYTNSVFNVNGETKEVDRYATKFIGMKSQRFLEDFEATDDAPWFLYVAPFAPHGPAIPQAKYEDLEVRPFESTPAVEETDLSDKPAYVRRQQARLWKVKEFRKDQIKVLSSVDDMIMGIRSSLSELDEDENLLVVFLSDNGYLWGEHGMAGKAVPYTESIGVPLYVGWAGHNQPDEKDDRLALNVDIAPTILDAAGAEPIEPMDGSSLLDSWDRSEILVEHWGENVPQWKSILTEDVQYIEYFQDGALEFSEYYDFSDDPYQIENLLGNAFPGDDPDVSELSERLHEIEGCVGVTCP